MLNSTICVRGELDSRAPPSVADFNSDLKNMMPKARFASRWGQARGPSVNRTLGVTASAGNSP
jgi:hypothetical protein